MLFPKVTHDRRKPKRGERGKISKEQYQLTLDYFGDTCTICNMKPVEIHHVVFKSQQGRSNYRNLMPLCKKHHVKAHTDRNFTDSLRDERAEQFGKLYYTDAYDLYDAGLIDEPTQDEYNNYLNEMGKFR